MIFSWLLLAVLAAPASAMPPCPSDWSLLPPAQRWPDVERVSDPRLLHGMSRELYDNCPRRDSVDSLLTSAAEKFLRLTAHAPERARERQEARFWLGMVYGFHAGPYDRDNREADAALTHFIALRDPGLRSLASERVRELRLRSARQLASISRYTQLNAQNLGKAGWSGSSQRVRCFLNTYPDATSDEEVREHLGWLSKRAHGFIHDFESDPRYELSGMIVLAAELDYALASARSPRERWPSAEDLDPGDPADPNNCYRRSSPIPGPGRFDFDFSKEGDERRKAAARARERARAVLEGTLQ